MAVLSNAQVQQLWVSNGGNPTLAPTMAAIAQAESGNNTAALNNTPSTGDYSVGLWQINYYGGLLGPRTQRYGSPSQLAADPNAQARAAVDLAANGQGLGNWSTWTSGAYRGYLGGAPASGGGNSAVGNLSAQPLPNNAPGAQTTDHCIIGGGSVASVPIIGSVGSVPCFFSTGNARALLGAGIIAAGVALGIVGVSIVVAGELKGPALRVAGAVVGGPAGKAAVLTGGDRTEKRNRKADTVNRAMASDDALGAERRANESADEVADMRRRRSNDAASLRRAGY